MAHLITEWSTEDPGLAKLLQQIAAYPEYSVERMEGEGTLHAFMAQWYQRKVGEHLGWKRAEQVSRGRRQKAPRTGETESED